MNFKEYITESINDKGLFKSIFMGGTSGSGKTFTISKINNPQIQPRLVSIDKIHEFMSTKYSIDISDYTTFNRIEKEIKGVFKEKLTLYINSMLPLWIDATSSQLAYTLRRVGILEYFGYDVAMVWVTTDIDTAIARAKQRQRKVPESFIRKTHELGEANKVFYKTKFPGHFFEARNNEGELNNEAINKLYLATSKYFMSPLANPVGKRVIEQLRASNEPYLVPSIFSKEQLKTALSNWYNT